MNHPFGKTPSSVHRTLMKMTVQPMLLKWCTNIMPQLKCVVAQRG